MGKRFAGDTARGEDAPYPGKASRAIEKVLKENAKLRLARSEPASGSGGRETAEAATASSGNVLPLSVHQ